MRLKLMATFLVGVVAGIVGTCLTYKYLEKEKEDNLTLTPEEEQEILDRAMELYRGNHPEEFENDDDEPEDSDDEDGPVECESEEWHPDPSKIVVVKKEPKVFEVSDPEVISREAAIENKKKRRKKGNKSDDRERERIHYDGEPTVPLEEIIPSDGKDEGRMRSWNEKDGVWEDWHEVVDNETGYFIIGPDEIDRTGHYDIHYCTWYEPSGILYDTEANDVLNPIESINDEMRDEWLYDEKLRGTYPGQDKNEIIIKNAWRKDVFIIDCVDEFFTKELASYMERTVNMETNEWEEVEMYTVIKD